MIYHLLNNLDFFNILFATNIGDCEVLGPKFREILDETFSAIQFSVPALIIILATVDLVKAVSSQDEKDMKIAQSNILKRIIIGAVIFLFPIVLGFLLNAAGFASGICDLG